MTPEFWITTLVVVATPGTGALYTIAAGLSRGWQASILAALACTLGIVPHLVAAITGPPVRATESTWDDSAHA